MRFLKPMKLGVSVDSWLRQVVRASQWVAKTWRYLLSLLRLRLWAEPFVCLEVDAEAEALALALALASTLGPLCLVELAAWASVPETAACVRVAMAGGRGCGENQRLYLDQWLCWAGRIAVW